MYREKGALCKYVDGDWPDGWGVSMYGAVPETMQQSRDGKNKARPQPDSLYGPMFDREF